METITGFEPGVLISRRYEVVQYLGVGAMGIVFKVKDTHLKDEIVALKLLHPHLNLTQRSVERFRSEVILARRLNSESIVRFFEFGQTDVGQYFVTMEYVAGSNLGDIIDSSPLLFDEALSILAQVCTALEVAAKCGVIHRDVKPQNIMVTPEGVAKLTDFGTARLLLDEGGGLTRTGDSVGTPYYMAPEQFRGDDVDERADIYSLGVTAFELFTGNKPFEANTFLSLAMMHLEDPLPLVDTKELDIPEWANELIQNATKKSADERFQNSAEFADFINSRSKSSGEDKTSAAKVAYVRAQELDQKTSKFRRRQLFLRIVVLSLFFLSGVAYTLPRISNSMYMRMAIPLLKLRGTRAEGLALFALKYGISFEEDILNSDIFYALNSSGRERKRYAGLAMIKTGLNLDSRNYEQLTPLSLAYRLRAERFVKEMLMRGIDVNKRNGDGTTAIFHAIELIGALVGIDTLLAHGAQINIKDNNGNTPISAASHYLRPTILERLLEAEPALVNEQNKMGETPSDLMIKRLLKLNISKPKEDGPVNFDAFNLKISRATARVLFKFGAKMSHYRDDKEVAKLYKMLLDDRSEQEVIQQMVVIKEVQR